MEQYRFDKQFLEAAKVAFDGNYSQLFMQVVEEMLGGSQEDRSIAMDEEGEIAEEPTEADPEAVKEDLKQLVSYASESNMNRLLMLVLTMNSTVRHFKAANKLFIEILRQRKLKGLLGVNRSFSLGQVSE